MVELVFGLLARLFFYLVFKIIAGWFGWLFGSSRRQRMPHPERYRLHGPPPKVAKKSRRSHMFSTWRE